MSQATGHRLRMSRRTAAPFTVISLFFNVPNSAVGRLEKVAKAVGGGYCRLQMPLSLALAVRGTVAGHRLGALEEGGTSPPSNAAPVPEGGGGGGAWLSAAAHVCGERNLREIVGAGRRSKGTTQRQMTCFVAPFVSRGLGRCNKPRRRTTAPEAACHHRQPSPKPTG